VETPDRHPAQGERHDPVVLRRIRKWQGRCYEFAYKAIVDDPDGERWHLVHGVVSGWLVRQGSIEHAWIEAGADAYDPVLDEWMPVTKYHAKYGTVAERRYTGKEVLHVLLDTRHYGPWHPG
jgi:hypothetical protein